MNQHEGALEADEATQAMGFVVFVIVVFWGSYDFFIAIQGLCCFADDFVEFDIQCLHKCSLINTRLSGTLQFLLGTGFLERDFLESLFEVSEGHATGGVSLAEV